MGLPATVSVGAREVGGPNKPPAAGSDRPPITVMRRGLLLAPASALDEALVAAYSPTAPLLLWPAQERHSGQHRLYFGLLGKVAENMPGDVSPEELHLWVKDNAGAVIVDQTTQELFRIAPASVAFEAMEQPDFTRFFRRVVDLMVTRILPGLDRATLTREASAMLGFSV